MNNLYTIIYYTSNREKPEFEKKIIDNLKKSCGDTPIISVSHVPIDLGINICVGKHDACNHNLFRQIQIGAKLATTPFVIHAESDCLYPKEYFNFELEDINESYKLDNNYILNEWGVNEYSGYYQKEFGTFAQITGRLHLIKEIDEVLKDRPFWDVKRKERPLELFRRWRWKMIHNKLPVVSLKTFDGMSKHTKIIEPPVDFIPYWGNANILRERIWS